MSWKNWHSNKCEDYFIRIEEEVVTTRDTFEAVLLNWSTTYTGSKQEIMPKIEIMRNQNLVYLMTLMENFFKEFINEQNLSSVLNGAKSEWDKYMKDATNPTTILNKKISFLNIYFIQYLLFNLYPNLLTTIQNNRDHRVIPDNNANKAFSELGDLRGCLVHAGGVLATSHINQLPNTLMYLNITSRVGTNIITGDQFTIEMAKLFQIIIWYLDDEIATKNLNVSCYNVNCNRIDSVTIKL
jgi:hypothetical protein